MAGLSEFLYGSVGMTPIIKMGMPGYSRLGNGLKGFTPQQLQTSDNTYQDVEYNRFQLVQAWNNVYQSQLAASHLRRVITPFRAVTNSGDILSRKNYSCGGPCQTYQSIPRVYGLSQRFGNIQNLCDGTTVPASACNGKYVYDSSDYVTYLKQQAIAKNYNDLSNGGDQNNASQSSWRSIRRY